MKRIDPPGCGCTDCIIGNSRPAQDEIEYMLGGAILPLRQKFDPGHGRPDLDLLYRIVQYLDLEIESRDRLDPALIEVRNTTVAYLNERPDDRKVDART